MTIDRTGGVERVPEPDYRCAHKQLVEAWGRFKVMDALDALQDAEHLLALCQQRYQDAQDELRTSWYKQSKR